jgi:hypothetical protein
MKHEEGRSANDLADDRGKPAKREAGKRVESFQVRRRLRLGCKHNANEDESAFHNQPKPSSLLSHLTAQLLTTSKHEVGEQARNMHRILPDLPARGLAPGNPEGEPIETDQVLSLAQDQGPEDPPRMFHRSVPKIPV